MKSNIPELNFPLYDRDRVLITVEEKEKLLYGQLKACRLLIASTDAKLVKIDSVLADIETGIKTQSDVQRFTAFRRVIPPFESLWLEGFWPIDKESVAFFVRRGKTETGYVCIGMSFSKSGDTALGPTCLFDWDTDDDGVAIKTAATPITMFRENDADWTRRHCSLLNLVMLNSIQRINCANAHLVESDQSAKRIRGKGKKFKGIVWHEIQLSSAPVRSSSSSGCDYDLPANIRQYSVRGHYADYTRGKGLFGNPCLRQLYWIPDHIRGSEEVGKVLASYSLRGDA